MTDLITVVGGVVMQLICGVGLFLLIQWGLNRWDKS
jgi:hypothetical protein